MDYTKVDVVDHYSGQEDDLQKFDIVYDSATKSGGGEDYREKSLSLLQQDESNHGKIQLHGCSLFGVHCSLFSAKFLFQANMSQSTELQVCGQGTLQLAKRKTNTW